MQGASTTLTVAASDCVIHSGTRNEFALLRAERQMTSAAMHLIGDNKGGLPE